MICIFTITFLDIDYDFLYSSPDIQPINSNKYPTDWSATDQSIPEVNDALGNAFIMDHFPRIFTRCITGASGEPSPFAWITDSLEYGHSIRLSKLSVTDISRKRPKLVLDLEEDTVPDILMGPVDKVENHLRCIDEQASSSTQEVPNLLWGLRFAKLGFFSKYVLNYIPICEHHSFSNCTKSLQVMRMAHFIVDNPDHHWPGIIATEPEIAERVR
jgi:hypothetical protein